MYNANVFDKRRDWHRHYNRPFEIHAVKVYFFLTYIKHIAACKEGYYGLYCNNPCPPGTFGAECAGRCYPECGNKDCDHIRGCSTDIEDTNTRVQKGTALKENYFNS